MLVILLSVLGILIIILVALFVRYNNIWLLRTALVMVFVIIFILFYYGNT